MQYLCKVVTQRFTIQLYVHARVTQSFKTRHYHGDEKEYRYKKIGQQFVYLICFSVSSFIFYFIIIIFFNLDLVVIRNLISRWVDYYKDYVDHLHLINSNKVVRLS